MHVRGFKKHLLKFLFLEQGANLAQTGKKVKKNTKMLKFLNNFNNKKLETYEKLSIL